MTTALENAKALYLHGIRHGHPREVVAAYIGARYTQHSTGVEAEMAVMDLFRVADGRIVEHWDVMEPVPPADELVNGGKF